MFYKVFYLGIGLVLCKIFYNLYYFLLTRHFFNKYEDYLKNKEDWYIQENRLRIISIFEKAGLTDSYQPNAQPLGHGYVSTQNISVFENLSVQRKDVVAIVYSRFKESMAIYKARMIEAINPIYWTEMFVFLPKTILLYLGLNAKSLTIKIFQIIWWLINFVSIIVGIFFNKEFKEFIEWIKNLTP